MAEIIDAESIEEVALIQASVSQLDVSACVV